MGVPPGSKQWKKNRKKIELVFDVLGPFWALFGPLWDHFATILGPFWYHFQAILEPLWYHFATILGSFLAHVGFNLEGLVMFRWF